MSRYVGEASRKKGGLKQSAPIIIGVLILIAIIVSFFTIIETTEPEASWLNQSEYLSSKTVFEFSASDSGRGLKNVLVTYSSGGKTKTLYQHDIQSSEGVLSETMIDFVIDLKGLNIKDGKGTLSITATDNSLWRLGKGNTFTVKYPVTVDSRPPQVKLLTYDHIVTKGGTELTLFKVGDDSVKSGVMIGERFFPSHKGGLSDPEVSIAFFTYPYDEPIGTPIFLIAEDAAGNRSKKSLPVIVREKEYRKRRINITDSFLSKKMPELLSLSNIETSGSLIDDFIKVNSELRAEMDDLITKITSESGDKLLWKGRFGQLSHSQVQALYADYRTYYYNGEEVDRQYHLGYDLASTSQSLTKAANSGVVVFSDYLGIYGNTVIIDHGAGIFTLYSHLSTIDVTTEESVRQGAVIGRTGASGLAGGDHLHFAVLIHGVPVTPLEWWDSKWIKNRLLKKINSIKKR